MPSLFPGRAIQSQDANDTMTTMGLFALSDDGILNPVNQIHIVPESAEAFLLTRDLDSLTVRFSVWMIKVANIPHFVYIPSVCLYVCLNVSMSICISVCLYVRMVFPHTQKNYRTNFQN